MAKKMDLPTKLRVAWIRATQEKPDLAQSYGSDGWDVWRDVVYKKNPMEIARLYAVAENTSYRWHDEYKQLVS